MVLFVIVMAIVMLLVGAFIGSMDHDMFHNLKARIKREPVEVKVFHKYETSTDYEALWELINTGNHVITVKYTDGGSLCVNTMYISKWSGENEVRGFSIWGNNDITKNMDKEKFIMLCKLNNIQYLQFVDKYEK